MWLPRPCALFLTSGEGKEARQRQAPGKRGPEVSGIPPATKTGLGSGSLERKGRPQPIGCILSCRCYI